MGWLVLAPRMNTLPAHSSAASEVGILLAGGFWQCLELCFGSGAAVLYLGVSPSSPRGKTSNSLLAGCSLFVPHLWGRFWSVEIRGHQALLGSGSGFSHHVFLGWLRGAGCLSLLWLSQC